ncbi:hypothetical protein O6H91_07G003400 [Diphasiastrum complanatum]|uniref:Uncharacterized protein n=1 Tax=Diphasiastrum complanatum TaxID=34168 RepID=A0ACC2D1T2_DIPCM|nr:hypothetical protein O6H91_07G003400 [Diphasiastrum complanatum]
MEVPMVASDAVRWTNMSIPPIDATLGASCCPPPRNAAGSVHIPGRAGAAESTYIIWRCHEEFPSVLELMQISWRHELPIGLRITFGEPLAPFAGIFLLQEGVSKTERSIQVLAVTVSGVAYLIATKLLSIAENGWAPVPSEPIKCQLSNEFARLNGATTFTATSGFFCVGGQNGSVLCFRVGNGPTAFKDSFELKGVEGGLGTLWGLVSWNKNVGSVTSLVAQEINSRPYLFALYEDGSARVWNLAQRVRLFHQSLCSSPEFTGYISSSMWLGAGEVPMQVAVLLENTMVIGRGTICVYRWHWAQTDGMFRPNVLTVEHAFPIEQGRVVDVKLFADAIWILQEASTGSYNLFKSKLAGGDSLSTCRLQEAELADQLLQGDGKTSDDLLFALHTIGQHTHGAIRVSISELFMRRNFQPGCCQIGTFRSVLRSRGRQISDVDIKSLTIDGFQKEVRLILDLEDTIENTTKILQEWQNFNQEYLLAWKQNNLPYSLFVDESTNSIGLIRKSSLSLMRFLYHMEQLIYGRRISEQVEVDIFPLEWQRGSYATSVLEGLLDCMDSVASHLGRLARAAFHEALLSPNDNALNSVIASFVRILDIGYNDFILSRKSAHVGFDNLREKRKEHHHRQRKFCLHMRLGFLELRDKAGSWDRVLDLVANFVGYLLPSTRPLTPGASSVPSSRPAFYLKVLAKTASQILWNHFEAARNLLLVLEVLINMQGEVGLLAHEVSRIRSTLIPQAQNALIVNLILHCLGRTYGETPQTEDFSLQLSSLKIDTTSTAKGWKGGTNVADFTLMEILAYTFVNSPSFVCNQSTYGFPSPGLLVSIGSELTSWLLRGDSSDSRLSFSGRAVTLFSILLQHGQYSGLQKLLTTMEKHGREQKLTESGKNIDCEWSAHLHILAFCLLAQARSRSNQASSKDYIQQAIRYFFRAALGLGEANEVLQTLFLGQGVQHLPGRGEAAAWRLHYFEWVMQVFEQYDLYEGARQFAHAALELVDEAVGVSATENSETATMTAVVAAIKGRLWANVFKFSVDLELYADAYCAIISNCDAESKYTCLRRFIVVLCERKAYQILCGHDLPYAGMLERVERELHWKAESSDVRAKPNCYKLLYSFHMHRHSFRHAAGYMYCYFLRLKEESAKHSFSKNISVLEEQIHSLAAAINALNLVHPSSAWIDQQYTRQHSPDKPSPMKRIRVVSEDHGESVEAPTCTGGGQTTQLITSVVLEKDYALTMAYLELAQTNIRHPMPGGSLQAEEVLLLLVQVGHYETAFSLLFLFWKDTSLKRELEAVFKILTIKSVSQQCQDSLPVSSPDLFASNLKLLPSASISEASVIEASQKDMNAIVSVGSTAKSVWHALQSTLEKYKNVHPDLPVVVAETILSFNKEMELPLWLIEMFKGGRYASAAGMAGQGADPAALLRIYIDHERVLEATSLLMEFLKAWASLRPVDVIKRKSMCAVWFPYTLIDRLQGRLSELASSKSDQGVHYQNLKRLLSSAVQSHLNQIRIDSKDLVSCME